MTNRTAIAFVFFMSCLPVGMAEQPRPTPSEADSLVTLERQSWDAWQKRDGKFFESFLSVDHVEVGFGGIADKTTVVTGVASAACVVRSYSVEGFKVAMLDAHTALLTYKARQDTLCAGKLVPSPVWVSSLYLKRDGRWLNVFYQQTPAGP